MSDDSRQPRPLHIRHVNLARGFRGGERQTLLLIEALARIHGGQGGIEPSGIEPSGIEPSGIEPSGFEQSLVCRRDSPMRDALSELGVEIELIDADHALAGHRHRHRHRHRRASLTHAHEAKAVHWAWIERRLRGTPYVLTRRVPQPVKDKPFNRLTYRGAGTAVAISSIIEAHLRSRDWCPVTRIPSVLSGQPSDPATVAALRERFAGQRVVGHIGALVDRHKGQRVLLDAARQLRTTYPDVRFLLLGEGEDAETLKCESADLDNVIWEGFRPNVGDYLDIMSLFAFPSRNEGLGSTLLDAMDHGVPIVASDVDGIPDLIENDISGVLVPAGDAEALAQALATLLEDPERCQRLAAGAGAKLETFTPVAMAESYLALYRQVLGL